jgi:hypothetical protein
MAKSAAAKAPPKSALTVFNVEQKSPEWFAARIGLPTASVFSTIMASGKDGGASVTRTKLLHKLAGEVITGEPAPEGYRNAAMDRGNVLEAEARDSYARRKGVEPQRVGFIRNFDGLKICGCSPDSLIGFDGGLEVKTAEAHVLIPMLQRPAAMPPEHRAQVMGSLWICEREFWDVTIYCHRSMPALDIRVSRDEAFIKELSNEVERFNYDLKKLVQQLRDMGAAG